MLSRTRIRIISVIMILLTIIIGTTLLIIYSTTKAETKKKNTEMLERFAEHYAKSGFPASGSAAPVQIDGSSFYAVVFNKDGSCKGMLNNRLSGYSDKELIDIAAKLLNSSTVYSEGKEITYLVSEGSDYTLITMMNTAATDNTIKSLNKNMLIFGSASILLLFALSISLFPSSLFINT